MNIFNISLFFIVGMVVYYLVWFGLTYLRFKLAIIGACTLMVLLAIAADILII